MTRPKELFTTGFTQGNRELLLPPTLQFQIIGVVGEEGRGVRLITSISISERVQIKGVDLKIVLSQKWQPVLTNYWEYFG